MAEPEEPEPEQARPESGTSRAMRITVTAALVVAVAALCLAAWSLLHSRSTSPDYSEADVSEATGNVCAAYGLAFDAVSLQTNAVVPPDPAGASAAAANARLALFVASENLVAAVADAPAAPEPLKNAVDELAAQYRAVASNYLAGKDNTAPAIATAFQRAGDAATRVNATCKR